MSRRSERGHLRSIEPDPIAQRGSPERRYVDGSYPGRGPSERSSSERSSSERSAPERSYSDPSYPEHSSSGPHTYSDPSYSERSPSERSPSERSPSERSPSERSYDRSPERRPRRFGRESSLSDPRVHVGERRRARRPGERGGRDAFATTDTKPGTGLDFLADEATSRAGCVVFIVDGESQDRGQHLTLHSGTLTIGKSRSCDLTLTDPRVSRCHIELSLIAGGIRVRDKGSTNGTYYLGDRVTEVTVHPGTQLRIGRTTIALLPNADGDGVELDPHTHYGRMLGKTDVMRRIFGIMRLLETSLAPVLVKGELGSGRRLCAETLHERSRRSSGPLVSLDCDATNPDLIDRLLFGHAAGALNGATSDRVGLIEQAHGGTLLLLNVDAMPIGVQGRLLRALETRRVRRLGDEVARPFDIRLIATARDDLARLVEAGEFKEELAYQLSVVQFSLPHLRDRAEDVPILAQHFAESLGAERDPLPQEVLDRLAVHEWPGNISELREVVCRLREVEDLDEALAARPRPYVRRTVVTPIDPSMPFDAARSEALAEFERTYLRALLERCDGDVSGAAKDAGLAPKAFRDLLARHGL